MSTESSVQLLYEQTVNAGDWLDVTNHCVVDGATFDASSNANPGTCEVVLRDPDRTLGPFITGHRLKLKIDGQPMWSGFALVNGKGNFLPAGDGRTATKSRKFVLRGVDNNKLLDARVLWYGPTSADYLSHIPYVTADEYVGATLKRALAQYSSMPTADPWLDITSEIDDIGLLSTETGKTPDPVYDPTVPKGPWEYPQQGTFLRETFEALSEWTGAVYYIGPDDKVHNHAIQDLECPWGFSDRPNHLPISSLSGPFEGAYWGMREFSLEEDGSSFGTDAFVWGGSEWAGPGQTVFHRATDPTLEALHGKWQLAETHFDEPHYKLASGVTIRSNMIVYGNPTGDSSGSEPGTVAGEGPRGLRFPQWTAGFVWHTTDVPAFGGVPRNLYPGDIVPIQLWTFSPDGGTTPFLKYLPLRSLRITFATATRSGKAVVRFSGAFNLLNMDNKFLWAWLRSRERTIVTATTPVVVTGSSTTAPTGGDGRFVPTPDPPDGTSVIYTVPFPYIPGTTVVTKNGLEQTWGVVYTESNPDAGEITFTTPPKTTDALFVRCRTVAS